MSQLEHRVLPAELATVRAEPAGEGQKPHIVGYAAVYYDGTPRTEYKLWEGAVERILPGAFTRAVAEDDVVALFNHDSNLLLGRKSAGTLKLTADNIGLHYDIDPPDTQAGRDTQTSLARKDLRGSSFSFVAMDEQWRKENGIRVREIRGARVYDVGPVTFPAYPATTAGVRSAEDLAEVRARCTAWEAEEERQAKDLAAKLAGVQARARAVEVGVE